MAIFESLFDVTYLSLVIGLGVRLLLEKTKGAKLFGIMAILLGMGDAFHQELLHILVLLALKHIVLYCHGGNL